jgi:hypothetical protein
MLAAMRRASSLVSSFAAARLEARAMSDWSDEETDDPHYADRRNFYKVEKWTSAVSLCR